MPIHYTHYLYARTLYTLAVFMLEDASSDRTNLGKHFLFVGLYVSSIKAGTRHIIFLDKLSSIERHSSCTLEDSSSRCIMCLVPILILETYNPVNNKCLLKLVQTDNVSSSIRMAITYTRNT